ncbi:single stranded DNA-binding protein [Halobacteroides halobius DSM 5150]|uniref:Single-stranded DNA-binding protein n=1 Tax=Halobacteroides halobius (strain ATCC 35273 / DSM 5150 / MD-1) TaxID=748449 RepID=L0KAK0_HALHC|nr:single-stranded DNA-binding protein [Halobacteroides halobius]AGB41389.1 single stranded DNA-binding protein [Halobacteroides halobius DSM 5150]
MLNQVGLVGRLARDPEMKELSSGTKMTNLVLAVDRDYKNKAGERETDFINVVTWRKLAKHCADFLTKGRLVSIEGKIEVSNWEDKETGERRYKTGVVANKVKFLDSPKNSAEASA